MILCIFLQNFPTGKFLVVIDKKVGIVKGSYLWSKIEVKEHLSCYRGNREKKYFTLFPSP